MGVEAAGRPLRKRMVRKRPVLSSLQQLRLKVSAITSPHKSFSWICLLNILCVCLQIQAGQRVLARQRWAPLAPGVALLSREVRVRRTQAGPPSLSSSLLAGKELHSATYDTVLECLLKWGNICWAVFELWEYLYQCWSIDFYITAQSPARLRDNLNKPKRRIVSMQCLSLSEY